MQIRGRRQQLRGRAGGRGSEAGSRSNNGNEIVGQVQKFVAVDACQLKGHSALPAVLERNRVVLLD
jgi:hypothetical protein